MKIELANYLNVKDIEEHIKEAVIVDKGDFILYEKRARMSVDDVFNQTHIFIADIHYIEVVDGQLEVSIGDKKYRSTMALKDLEIAPLIRINKSCLVNLECVEDIKVKMNMKYSLRMSDRWFDVNRTYYASFKDALGL